MHFSKEDSLLLPPHSLPINLYNVNVLWFCFLVFGGEEGVGVFCLRGPLSSGKAGWGAGVAFI